METLRRLERALVALETGLLVAIVCGMVALSFLQVALRGLFSAGLLWADILLRHLVLWVAFLGAAAAAAADKQFAMDAAARALSGRAKAAAGALTGAFTAGVCCVLAGASRTFLLEEYGVWSADHARGVLFSIGAFHCPGWVFELILPAGFALLALHYALKLGLSLLELRAPADARDGADGPAGQGAG